MNKVHRRLQKERRIEEAIEELTLNEIKFTKHNMGIHFILHFDECIIDFCPTTGKFWYASKKIKGKGLDMLFETINKHIYDN